MRLVVPIPTFPVEGNILVCALHCKMKKPVTTTVKKIDFKSIWPVLIRNKNAFQILTESKFNLSYRLILKGST